MHKPDKSMIFRDGARRGLHSLFDAHHQRLDLAVHSPCTESLRQRGGGLVSRLAQSRGIARLDLTAQQRALAIANRRLAS